MKQISHLKRFPRELSVQNFAISGDAPAAVRGIGLCVHDRARRGGKTRSWQKANALARFGVAALFWLCASNVFAQTNLVLWHAYGKEEERGLLAAIALYETRHPGTHVETLAVPFGGYGSKLESAIPAGAGPDLFIDTHDRMASYIRSRFVHALSIEPGALTDFEASHLSALRSGDALHALPLAVKCAALYLNTSIVNTPPVFLEDLVASRTAGIYPLVFEAFNAYYAAAFVHAFGGVALTEEGHYGMNSDKSVHAIELLVALSRQGLFPEETNGDLVKTLFASGKAGAAISGPWLAPSLPGDLPYVVRPLPRLRASGETLQPYATIEGIAVSAKSQNIEAAQKLALFIASGEAGAPAQGAVLRAQVGRQIVASKSAWLAPNLGADATMNAFREAAESAVPMPTHINMRAVFVPSERALRKALRGSVSAKDALNEAARRFEDETREPPPRVAPNLWLMGLGLGLLLLVFAWLQRARTPEFRAALRRSMPAYAYLTHAAVIIFVLILIPLAVGIGTSFFAGRGRDLHFAGFANYIEILTNRGQPWFEGGSFWFVLGVTILWTAMNLALHVTLGVGFALLLNRLTAKWATVYRVLMIVPWAVPSYVTALAWKGMFHRQLGAINAILEAVGVHGINWFASWPTAFAANLATNVWLGFPFMMVVTLGALAGIPRDLYEAARVDGATPWQQFTGITLPLLRPALAPAVALGAVWTFNMFNVVFLVSGGEPDGTTEILVSEAYRWAFTRSQQYGYAAAYAVLIFVLLLTTTMRRRKAVAP